MYIFHQGFFSLKPSMNSSPLRHQLLRLLILPCLASSPALLASTADAALMITVKQGSAPVGSTEWMFSGSSTYIQLNPGGAFAVVPPLTNIIEWKGDALSDFVKTGAYDNYTPTLASGTISLTVAPVSGPVKTATISALHVDHDDTGDDFGVGLDGSSTSPVNTAISLNANAVVSWSGSGIFPVDITKLNYGSFLFAKYGASSSSRFGDLPITINVQEAPGPLPLLGLGVAFPFSRQMRRKALALRLHASKKIGAS